MTADASDRPTSKGRQSIRPGDRFGRLVVIERFPSQKKYDYRWVCRCDCGGQSIASACNLRTGAIVSCGCYRLEKLREAIVDHGMTRSPAYVVWMNMRKRCSNSNSISWPNYGGRGIRVCREWDESFSAFHSDMGDPPLGMTLDRIDVNGDYCKSNCRWATNCQQARNRRSNHLVTIDGETRCIADWIETFGLTTAAVYGRLKRGWDDVQALTTPVRPMRRNDQ